VIAISRPTFEAGHARVESMLVERPGRLDASHRLAGNGEGGGGGGGE
jgi:hypothetical protein